MSHGSCGKGLAKPKAGSGVPGECQTQRKGNRLVQSGHAAPCRLLFFMMSANLQDSFLELHSVTYSRRRNIHFSKTSAYRWRGREGGWRDKTIYWQNNKRKINLYDRWASEIYSVIRKHKEIHGLPGRVSRQHYSIDGNTIALAGSVCLFLSKSSSTFCWSG